MKIVNFQPQYENVGATGPCPHCTLQRSYFRPVATSYKDSVRSGIRIANMAQCEACKNLVLILGLKGSSSNVAYELRAVYPAGKPDEFVDEAVPNGIASDFREALRCYWIKAFKSAVVMCRRALQASAIALKAKGDRPVDQIDDLAKQGKITESLKDFAHEVRLTGNVGAHPDKDGLGDVAETDAEDIIAFTREYFHHVYVMPAKLKARKEPPEVEAKS